MRQRGLGALLYALAAGWILGGVGAAAGAESFAAKASAVRVIDGDTLDVGGVRVRLHGIDAPETKQPCLNGSNVVYLCGQAATKALREMVRGKDVRCEPRDRDRYGRVVAVCRADGADINEHLVREGRAVAYRQYSRDYVATEDEARRERRGLWAGEFVPPAEFRRRR